MQHADLNQTLHVYPWISTAIYQIETRHVNPIEHLYELQSWYIHHWLWNVTEIIFYWKLIAKDIELLYRNKKKVTILYFVIRDKSISR